MGALALIVPQLKLWLMGDSSDESPQRVRFPIDHSRASFIANGDREILDRLRLGDEVAFEALYVDLAPRLWQFAYRFLRSRTDAEDVVHDVFHALWNGRTTVHVQSSIVAYLYGAVRFRAFRVRRDRLRDATVAGRLGEGVGSHPVSPASEVQSADFDAAVRRIVESTRPPARDVLYLRWAHAMSYDDIAGALGISSASARQHVHRMLRKLGPAFRRLLDD